MSIPRLYNREERLVIGTRTRFSYIDVGRGHVTVASALSPTRAYEYFAVAWCSPKDQFCRVEGRNLAKTRLFEYINHQVSDCDGNWMAGEKIQFMGEPMAIGVHSICLAPSQPNAYERAEMFVQRLIENAMSQENQDYNLPYVPHWVLRELKNGY